jgi:hypothetical protein
MALQPVARFIPVTNANTDHDHVKKGIYDQVVRPAHLAVFMERIGGSFNDSKQHDANVH